MTRTPGAALKVIGASCAALVALGCGAFPDRDGADCVSTAAQRIYGGAAIASTLDDFAFSARALGAIENQFGTLYCTGTLVSRGWVLSAAHCSAFDGLYFRLAAFDASGPRLRLGRPHPHPTADLVLIELTDRDGLDDLGVAPLDTSAHSEDTVRLGETLTLAGVGLTESGESGELRLVQEPVVAVEPASISVDGRGSSGACSGDSGGPLIHGSGRDAIVVGILSKGAGSCRGIDVYTRLDADPTFIEQTTSLLPPASGCHER